MKRLLSSLVAALALVLVAGTARAEPLKVTANVLKACKVTATTDILINWDPYTAGTETGTGGFTVTCTKDVNLNIAANEGANGGAGTTRYVSDGTNTIPYTLSLGATALTVGADAFVATSTGKSVAIPVNLSATLSTGSDLPGGTVLTDDVVVTFSAL